MNKVKQYINTSLLFMLFAFIMGSIFLLAPHYQKALLFDKISMYFIILYLLIIKYISIPYKNLFSKIRWLIAIFWCLSAITINFYLKWNPEISIIELYLFWGNEIPKSAAFRKGIFWGVIWILWKPFILVLLYWKTYRVEKQINFKSDSLNATHIFLVLIWPDCSRDLLPIPFLRFPIAHQGLIANGYYYGYKRKTGKIEKEKINNYREFENCTIIQTNKLFKNEKSRLDNLVGTKWSLLSLLWINDLICYRTFNNRILKQSTIKILRQRKENEGGRKS